MKNWRNFKSNRGFISEEQVCSANAGPIAKEPEPMSVISGPTQENYVNPKFLGAGMVVSISNMSFMGLWL